MLKRIKSSFFGSDFSGGASNVRCASGGPSDGDSDAADDLSVLQRDDSIQTVVNPSEVSDRLRKLRTEQPMSAYSRIAEVSLYFERTWSRERILSIEDCLSLVPEEIRGELFERLLEIDLSLGFERGASVEPAIYKKRFPQWTNFIERVYRQVTQQSVIIHKMRVGRRIGNYVIEQIIGKGGMGIVYKALDQPFHRMVAIKYLLPDSNRRDECFELFQREIALMGQLPAGTAFAQAYSCDKDGDFSYLVMEYIDGVDLVRYVHEETSRRKESGPLDWREATRYIREIASGLDTIHRLGIIHRDIKPENIMLDTKGRVRILDLGLGLLQDIVSTTSGGLNKENNSSQKKSAAVMGTPAYMSPEGFRSPETIDVRSDLYSLGGTYFFLLTGRLPIEWYNPMGDEPPIPLREFLRREGISIPSDVLAILTHLLEPDRERRYSNAWDVLRDLDALLDRHSAAYRQKQRRLFRGTFILFLFVTALGLLSYYMFAFSDVRRFSTAMRLYQDGEPLKSLAMLMNTHPDKLPDKVKKDFFLFRGQLYQEQAKDEEFLNNALSDYYMALRQDPDDVPCMERVARIHALLKEFQSAKAIICRAIKIAPRDDFLRLIDGKINILWGESGQKNTEESRLLFNEAISILSDTLRGGPLSSESLYWRARAYDRAGHESFALYDLDSCIKRKDAFAQAYQLRGDIRFAIAAKETTTPETAKQMARLAAEDYRFILNMAWTDKRVYSNAMQKEIRSLDLAQEYSELIERCSQWLTESPQSYFALQYRGKAAFLLNVDAEPSQKSRMGLRQSLEDITEAIHKDTDNQISARDRAEMHIMTAIIYFRLDEAPEKCVSSVNEALVLEKETSLYRFNETLWNVYEVRRQAYATMGEMEKARSDAQRAFEVMLQTSEYATMTSADIAAPQESLPREDTSSKENPLDNSSEDGGESSSGGCLE